jgi:hypothetical protein
MGNELFWQVLGKIFSLPLFLRPILGEMSTSGDDKLTRNPPRLVHNSKLLKRERDSWPLSLSGSPVTIGTAEMPLAAENRTVCDS